MLVLKPLFNFGNNQKDLNKYILDTMKKYQTVSRYGVRFTIILCNKFDIMKNVLCPANNNHCHFWNNSKIMT